MFFRPRQTEGENRNRSRITGLEPEEISENTGAPSDKYRKSGDSSELIDESPLFSAFKGLNVPVQGFLYFRKFYNLITKNKKNSVNYPYIFCKRFQIY